MPRRLFLWLTVIFIIASAVPETPCRATPPGPNRSGPPPSLDPALRKMYSAQYGAAQPMLEAWLKLHPDDFRALNYLAETIMDLEMVQEQLFSGSAYIQSGQVFEQRRQPLPPGFQPRLEGIFNRAQSLEEARLREDSKDQDALYWLGVTHAGRTEFYFILLRSYFAALHEGKQSLKDNKRLLKLNPDFTDAYFVVGLAKYTVGMLPWYVRWMTSLAGVHGSVSEGIADLERVSEQGRYARMDARIVLVPIYEREKKYSRALTLLQGLESAYPENYLAALEIARVQKAEGDWRAAAQTYDSAVMKFVTGKKDWIPRAEILWRAGQAHEHLGELEKALGLYHKAGEVPGKSAQIYEADLAAARLDQHFNHTPTAKKEYEFVARAIPNTDLGRQAQQALQKLH